MSVPYVKTSEALPALFERLRTRAPDDLYPDVLEATGFGADEYRNVNSLLYFLNFYVPGAQSQPQSISAFWKDRYFQGDDPRGLLGYMAFEQYKAIYTNFPEKRGRTKAAVKGWLKKNPLYTGDAMEHIDDAVTTFFAIDSYANVDRGFEKYGHENHHYMVYGSMPPSTKPPKILDLISKIPGTYWIISILIIIIIVSDNQAG